MSEETSFVQWRASAKEERKTTGFPVGTVIAWVAGVVVVLVAIVALFMYLG